MLGNFGCAALLYIDQKSVQNAQEITIPSVDLFIKAKPEIGFNSVGLYDPGISVFIAETKNGVPFLDHAEAFDIAWIPGSMIRSSSDATVATKFRFQTPKRIKTNTYYALIVRFDGNAKFDLWKNVAGDWLVGTHNPSMGAASPFSGVYFDYINTLAVPSYGNDALWANDEVDIVDQYDPNHIASLWNPVNDTSLKFTIYAARYRIDGIPVPDYSFPVSTPIIETTPSGTKVTSSANTFVLPSPKMEFITFDQNLSTKEVYVGGQKAYQNTFSYPGGRYNNASFVTVATYGNTTVVANSLHTNGASFSWNSIFPGNDRTITFVNGTDVDIRTVAAIVDARTILLTEPLSFSNAVAQFMITPTAVISSFDKSSPFGVSDSIMTLTSSTANSTIRFVNNTIEYTSVVTGGNTYSNSDILYFVGYQNVANELVGGYKAVANIVTNSNGAIVGIYASNSGAGFTIANNIQIVIANSTSNNITSNTTAGSGATIQYTVGATIKTEMRPQNNFRGIKVVNLPLSDAIPFFDITKQNGTDFTVRMTTKYKRVRTANTLSGFAYYVTPNTEYQTTELDVLHTNELTSSNIVSAFVSWSNEFNLLYANGAYNDQITPYNSLGILIDVDTVSNNDYSTVFFNSSPKLIFSKYLINNDGTNEHTDRGNAWAKGVSKTINFGRAADDLVVYLDAYKPANTDILVYGRVFNSVDSEAMDDKDWTLLEAKNHIQSSSSDQSDIVELQFGFPQYPNTSGPMVGVATVANNSANLVGVGTTFTSLTANSLVRVYPTLFPNTNIIAVVSSVTNNTFFTLQNPITNNSFFGQSLTVEPVLYNHQAFNNIMNGNVARYYNSSMVPFDGYSSMKLKIVMLSSEPNKIPRIDSARIIGASS